MYHLVYFAVLLSIVNLVRTQDELESRIIGGEEANEGTAPYIVGIWVGDKFACAGSIVKGSKRTIITAAHCVHQLRVDQFTVGIGSVSRLDLVKYHVDAVRIHPGYVFYDLNDIALIYLDEDLEFNTEIDGISLETEVIKPKEKVTTYGWGWTRFPGMSSDALNTIDVTTIALEICKLYWQRVSKNHICTVKWPQLGGACKGDSGGPLVRNNKLIGIMSWGYSPCGTGYPDVFTRISPYIGWIKGNLL